MNEYLIKLKNFTLDSALEYKVNEFREALENSDIIYIVDVVYMGMAAESLRRSIHQEGILWKS